MRHVYQINSTDSYKCLRGKVVLSFMTSDCETIESCQFSIIDSDSDSLFNTNMYILATLKK